MPRARLVLKHLGMGSSVDWQTVRGSFFHRTATRVRLYTDRKGPYHGIQRPGADI